ncbi:MAG: PrsW family intramembrane metalloprotease [Anaerolineales bacterium]|nr:PrsW family intramembrane metalloprotease [Anaerolineales bacterium]
MILPMVVVALLIAFTIPVVFLYLLNRFDLFNTGKSYFNVLTLVGGMLAYYAAAQINPAVVNMGWASREQVVRFVAPVIEEILKAVILVYLVQRADFNYVVDGALYGFGSGIGFAVTENYEYVMGHSEVAMTIALARVFSTNLMHATSSGLIGTALAYQRGDKTIRGRLAIAAGYIISISIHMGFNTLVNSGGNLIVLIFAILIGVTGAALIWYIIKRGLNIQKDWVAEKLGMADRVTQEETRVVSNIEAVHEVLAPVEARFGAEKAALVRSLIYKQAEIGIKRKLLETAANETRKKEINTIIEDLVKEINLLRNQIGTYCMMMVREVYLSQDLQIWSLLNARIASAGLGQKGGGLWNRVSERLKDSSSQEDKS